MYYTRIAINSIVPPSLYFQTTPLDSFIQVKCYIEDLPFRIEIDWGTLVDVYCFVRCGGGEGGHHPATQKAFPLQRETHITDMPLRNCVKSHPARYSVKMAIITGSGCLTRFGRRLAPTRAPLFLEYQPNCDSFRRETPNIKMYINHYFILRRNRRFGLHYLKTHCLGANGCWVCSSSCVFLCGVVIRVEIFFGRWWIICHLH